jgi:hypothetical protein
VFERDSLPRKSKVHIEKLVKGVPNRGAPDDPGADECEKERRGNVLRRWKVDALLLFGEQLHATSLFRGELLSVDGP